MSKKIIAGLGVVAGLAVALAPVATFADDNVTSHADTLRLTVPAVCTLGTLNSTTNFPEAGTDATAHASETGWTEGTASSQTGRTDVFAKNVAPGEAYADFATSVFTIHCNKVGGYNFKAQANNSANLTTSGSPSYTIPTGDGLSSGDPVDLSTDGHSYWNFRVSAVSNAYVASSNEGGQEITSGYDSAHEVPYSEATTIVTGHGKASIATAETITVKYGAGIDAFQEPGTYEGTVTYTLVAL